MYSHTPALHDRASVDEAVSLIDRLGDEAIFEAASRADAFRDSGNLLLFCRWREIERAIQLLQLEEVVGELH